MKFFVLYLFTRDAQLIERNQMQNEIPTTLFGKYEIISLLGTGSFGSVYLSKHHILECYRAIKCIPKHGATDSLLQEARLLKSLHHPGIPTIYDVEEDDTYYYLIEEYAEGESLEEFLLQQSYISQSTFIDLSLQLCDIFCYLHTLKPSPILYLDLKPEHIIVCGMQIKLIDFGVATYLSNLGNIYNLFGNRDFSAPELFSGKMPDILSDIYSIGKIMQYLSNYLDVSLSPRFQKIILKSIDTNPACRFETVDKLTSAIEKEKLNKNQSRSRKNIAVIGGHRGCGSTHLSISLTSTLNYMGYHTIYYEMNQGSSLQQASSVCSPMKERDGMLLYRFFKGYPHYGAGILLPEGDFDICIYDYGDSILPNDLDADDILYVCSNSIWHRYSDLKKAATLLLDFDNLKIICNMGQRKTLHDLSRNFTKCIYKYPYDADPFLIDKKKCCFFSKLLSIKRRPSLFFHLKNIILHQK